MIERYLLKNKKLYVAFFDFRKVFDLISYYKLWPILCKSGLKGNMLQTVQSMYKIEKSTCSEWSDSYKCFSLPERPQARGSNYPTAFLVVHQRACSGYN